MKRVFIITMLSLVTFTYLYSASGSRNPGERWVRRTINYTHPEYGDIGKAKEALDSAFSYESNLKWPLTYVAAGSYYNELYAKNHDFSALLQSADYFVKAAELDTASNYTRQMQFQLLAIPNSLINEGAKRFEEAMYADAAQAFKRVVNIQRLAAYSGDMDTSMVYNTALAAYQAADLDLAIQYFELSADYNYQKEQSLNNVRLLMLEKGDTLGSIEVLHTMNQLYPQESDYTRELVRLYLAMEKTDEALEFARIGQEQQPDSEIFPYAEGAVYYAIGQQDKAIEAFSKAIAINTSFLPAYISLAQVHIDKANKYIEQSNNPRLSDKEYKEYVALFRGSFKSALEQLKKADKINPNDVITLETMREIYYRMDMMDQYKELDQRIKAIEEAN